MPLTDADVREILRVIDSSGAREIKVKTRGFALHVIRDPEGAVTPGPVVTAPEPAVVATPASADASVAIDSPMLGTFYSAEAPGEPPFVEVGSLVEADTIVCIIEVMKMMNSVPAGVSGKIVEVCNQNGQLVEYGAPLFRVEPA